MLGELLENQADILKLTGQTEKAEAAYSSAMEMMEEKDWIGRSRILRKTGLCYQAVSRFQVILEYFQQAQHLLEQWTGDKPAEWWHEWLELSIERMFTHYWLNETDAIQALSQAIEPHIERYGTPTQQSSYYTNLAALNFRLEAYLLSEQTVNLARKAVNTSLISKDLQMISVANFYLGFSLLWHNQIEEGIIVLEESLALADKTGDIIVKTRNLTYLTVAHRRLGNIAKTDLYAHKCLAAAQLANMLEYSGTAAANLAWLAWKSEEEDQVDAFGKQAFGYWERVPASHSSVVFVWTAAFPLAALYCQRGNLPRCIEYLEMMLLPGRKRLEPELEQCMAEVIAQFKSSGAAQLHQQMVHLLEMAERYRYL